MQKIHLIGNAHLDPVWLWQWQEGFAEIKATYRSALTSRPHGGLPNPGPMAQQGSVRSTQSGSSPYPSQSPFKGQPFIDMLYRKE